MKNREIAEIFERMADLLELQEANVFRINSYRKAARTVGDLTEAIEQQLGDKPPGDRVVLLKVHRESKALIFEEVIESISEAGGDIFHVVDRQMTTGR